MALLSLITLVWAFSFSLIGVYLAGQVDPWFSALFRVAIALIVILPFFKPKQIPMKTALSLMGIGAIQIGVMYGFYYHAFLFLSVPEVLLFTIFTPIYITFINDLIEKHFSPHNLLVAVIAISGALVLRKANISDDFWNGFLVTQGANICFAIGQVCYRRLNLDTQVSQLAQFAYFFIGALVVCSLSWILLGDIAALPSNETQWGVLVYLGIIASGLGYFAWNKGCSQVSVGTVATMNNALIPAGILVNVLFWGTQLAWLPLILGSMIIAAALWLDYRKNKTIDAS